MMFELKKGLEEGKVFFGIRQAIKNSDNLDKALVSSDCREQIKNFLKINKIDFEELEFSKEELATKLELDFRCEVFGLKK